MTGLDAYLNRVGRFPVLSEEAQLRHAYAIHRWVNWPEGRENAPLRVSRAGQHSMDRMVSTNLRLVVSVARRYQNRGLEMDDLIQEGNLGLIRGLELFDPTRGYRLSTYAYWWIRQAMTRALHSSARMVRLPLSSYDLLFRVQRETEEHLARTGEQPTLPELAARLETTPQRISMVLDGWAATQCYSLDAAVTEDGPSTLVEMMTSPRDDARPYREPTDLLSFLQVYAGPNNFRAIFGSLLPVEQRIVEGLYFYEKKTRQLAEELNMTLPEVRSHAQRSCRILRLYLPDTFATLSA